LLNALFAGNFLHGLHSGAKDGSGTFHEIWDAVKCAPADDAESDATARPVQWLLHMESSGIQIVHKFLLHSVTWHQQGDYFATVAPTGNTQVTGSSSFNTNIMSIIGFQGSQRVVSL
jgi:hypothetical protein